MSSTKFNSDKYSEVFYTINCSNWCFLFSGRRGTKSSAGCDSLWSYISFLTVQLRRMQKQFPGRELGENRIPLWFPYQLLVILDDQQGSIVGRALALAEVPGSLTLWEKVTLPLEVQPAWWTQLQGRTHWKRFGQRRLYWEKTKNNLPSSSTGKGFTFWLHHIK